MANMDKIADKIQKLLNLAGNNPNEEEAQDALLKAQELMAQYNVDMEALGGKEKIKYSFEVSNVKANPRARQLLNIIANAFACKALISAGRHCGFFGREDNAKAAKECMEFMHRTMERGINRVCKEHGLKSSAVAGSSDIYNGYAAGFLSGLKETVDAQTVALAVVVTQDVKDAFANRFPNIGQFKGKGTTWNPAYKDAYHSGVADGRSAMGKRSLKAGN